MNLRTKPLLRGLVLVGFFLLSTVGIILVTVGPWTEYADHFSRRNFRAIRLGDNQDRVRSLVGEPLQREVQDVWVASRTSATDGTEPKTEKRGFLVIFPKAAAESSKATRIKKTREVWYYSRPTRFRKTFFFFAIGFDEQGRAENISDRLLFD
jgi:hypothetical protein